jgi:hypothetical protein
MSNCKPYSVDRGAADPLEAIVNAYLTNNAEEEGCLLLRHPERIVTFFPCLI